MDEHDDPPLGSGDSVAGGIGIGDESNGPDVDTDQETPFVDSKDDMFVDAPEELNFETPSKESVTKADDDNGGLGVDESKNEREALDMELVGLHEQLKLLTGESISQDGNIVVGSSLHDIVGQFSKFLETVKEERVQHDNATKELQGIVNEKDHEIADLTAKISELSTSLDIASAAEVGYRERNEQVDAMADRILLSLSSVFGQEEVQYGSVSEKLTHAEYHISLLSAKYSEFYYGIDQLKKCLSRDESDISMQEDFGSVLGAACSELFELKQKETVLFDKLSHLEDENRKLAEQVTKDREMMESVNTEFGKVKADLEQEKTRYANTKEKLSMAVTKGKALVQQRDALKHSLLEKTTELENRLTELQEKKNALDTSELMKGQLEQLLAEKMDELEKCSSELHEKYISFEAYELTKKELEQSLAEKTKELEECLMKVQEMSTALDASEISKGEMVKSEALVASYQEMLSQRSTVIENFEAILSQIDIPEEFQSVDIVDKIRWLAGEREELRDVSQEYNRLKDAILQIDLPEEKSESNLETRFDCIRESFFQAKAEVSQLEHRIESLSTSLSSEIQEKDKVRMELDDMASRLNEMEGNIHRVSLEKDEIVRKLVEISGLTVEGDEHNTSTDMLVHKSFDKIGERYRDSGDSSCVNEEVFETIQSLLYVRDQELSLCQEVLGEDMQVRLQVSNLSNEMEVTLQELASAKEEKNALEKDLERSEEKSALLREKLTMAIKKGKGLVQDRENLKSQLDDRNSEIGKLKLELEQLGCTVDGYKNQINSLSGDLERIQELEAELMAVKDQRDQLEHLLSQNNAMLENVIRSVDSVTIPVDLASEDPLEKIARLCGYLKGVELAKIAAQEELEKVKEEASKLEETCTTLKSVEDALSIAEDNIDRLSEENRLIRASKEKVELELQKAGEDTSSLASRLDEAFAARKSFEDALKQAERTISDIITEKEEAQSSTAAAEMELEKVREEAMIQTKKLEEAHGTIKSLENALSQAESDIQSLSKQIDDDKEFRNNLENELKKLKDEADSQATNMAEASMTIRSLEEALMKAENSFSALEGEKLKAEVEISTLGSKLNACMEELGGVSGNSQSRSLEIMDHLDNLEVLLKDEGLVSRVNEFLEKEFRILKDMELIVRDIRRRFSEKGLQVEEFDIATEDDSAVAKPLLNSLDNPVNTELENGQGSVAGEDEISSCLRKFAEGIKLRNETLDQNFGSFSASLDLLVGSLLKSLTAARDDVINVLTDHESLKENMRSTEIIIREQENTMSTLQDSVSALLSACGEAVRDLQLEPKNNLLDFGNFAMPQFQEIETGDENVQMELLQGLQDGKCIDRVRELSSATAKARTTIKRFETTSNGAVVLIQEMETKLKETSLALEKAVEERDSNRDKVLSLEADAESMEAFCRELKHQLEDLKSEEEKWHEKEKELSSLYDKLMVKEQEAKDTLISAADIRALFDKMNGIEMPSADPQYPYDVKKLFYMIDCVSDMQHQIDLLTYEKNELESSLQEKTCEILSLKEATEAQSTTGTELEKAKTELSLLISGLDKLLAILAGKDPLVDPKSAESPWTLLQALEKQVTSLLLLAESSKSKAQELGVKFAGSQKLVDELTSKVEALEDELQNRAIQPDVVQERSIFEAPSTSEISEIDDKGSLAKNSISPVSSSAQVRTIRKGSADHLAISIDSESEHLMNQNDTDEDKGHVFKSLNMSGLIPKQGKVIADRVDGIWVSGGRVLMSRPRARLGVIAYCLILHLWLLASIL
ncbi:PREDICTED: myosin-11 isoform X2 [Tarenaya hassleriana]|uniref:myosin-11 isoform X1 n=1 Tax=Tarenaya hassleriana TaxID=28532 RepID=UPI00053C1112|nr:PREDICTED: myosin-11 isoform X1 [Tarenaya hassleriana]XP_010556185.1 PREDICTED: myosin-11 isoform X2 [Tarenaya hassleriana]